MKATYRLKDLLHEVSAVGKDIEWAVFISYRWLSDPSVDL